MPAWPSVDDLLELALDQADAGARCDLVIERAFLGGILCSREEAIARTWFLLAPGDFFDQVHAAIWAACLRLRRSGQVEPLNVGRAVGKMPGATARVAELVEGFCHGENEFDFLLRAAATIRHASAQRAAARARASRRAA